MTQAEIMAAINECCARHRVTYQQLCGRTQRKQIVDVRKELSRMLSGGGLSSSTIGHYINRDGSTVRYYLTNDGSN